jgi:hypothetical protein
MWEGRPAQNAFGIHLLTEVAAQTRRQNVFLSSTSVFMGLMLAELGASGATGEAIRQTHYLPAGISSADLRRSVWAHACQFRSHDSIQLSNRSCRFKSSPAEMFALPMSIARRNDDFSYLAANPARWPAIRLQSSINFSTSVGSNLNGLRPGPILTAGK